MSRKLLVASLVGAGAVVALALGVDRPHVVYAFSVSRFLKQPMRDTEVRIAGQLVHGSICRVREPCEYRFRLMGDSGEQLQVSYPECVVPDTFRDLPGLDVTVAVEGELVRQLPHLQGVEHRREVPWQILHGVSPPDGSTEARA